MELNSLDQKENLLIMSNFDTFAQFMWVMENVKK